MASIAIAAQRAEGSCDRRTYRLARFKTTIASPFIYEQLTSIPVESSYFRFLEKE
jgi:hypothetical protein